MKYLIVLLPLLTGCAAALPFVEPIVVDAVEAAGESVLTDIEKDIF